MGKLSVLKTPIGITLIVVVIGAAMIVGYYLSPWFKGLVDGVTPSMAAVVDWMIANSIGPVSYLAIAFLGFASLTAIMGAAIERQIMKVRFSGYQAVGATSQSSQGTYRPPNSPPDARKQPEAPPQ